MFRISECLPDMTFYVYHFLQFAAHCEHGDLPCALVLGVVMDDNKGKFERRLMGIASSFDVGLRRRSIHELNFSLARGSPSSEDTKKPLINTKN